MASPVKRTRPSEVTTSDGIGGALLRTLIPTPPRTAKEMVSTRPRAIHSFRYDMDNSFQRCRIAILSFPRGHFTITSPSIHGCGRQRYGSSKGHQEIGGKKCYCCHLGDRRYR